MSWEQAFVFVVLLGALALFAWGRWRYDLVALMAMLAVVVAGVVPPAEAFTAFGHPAVVTVAAALMLSRALKNAGMVNAIARLLRLERKGSTTVQIGKLAGVVALASGLINDVAAMALLLPVAIRMARNSGKSPSLFLMPMAFASLLGGLTTLIGTPPNVIVAAFRGEALGAPFRMFDFTPVGGVVAVAGVLTLLVAWRLLPSRQGQASAEDLFHVKDYISELVVPEGSSAAGRTVHDLEEGLEERENVLVLSLVREGGVRQAVSSFEVLRPGDVLLVQADSESLGALVEKLGLSLVEGKQGQRDSPDGGESEKASVSSGETTLAEAIVTHDSRVVGRSARGLDMRMQYGVNLLAVGRSEARVRERLSRIRFTVGDILLLQGPEEKLGAAITEMGCLPLAARGLTLGRPRRLALALAIFVAALASATVGLLSLQVALLLAAVAMVLTKVLPLREAYESIDGSLIVLLGAMIPVSAALTATGGTQMIADGLAQLVAGTSPGVLVMVLMVTGILLSNIVNNAAAALVMAPIALELARTSGVSADPLLMAIAVGVSAPFLTPIAHQSNAMAMGPGGYRFVDYLRLGLPLQIVVVAVGVPMILVVWPIGPGG